jgi:hypothetical protein
MAELKTKKNDAPVEKFIDSVPDQQKRKDAHAIVEMIRQATKMEPKMWGSSIIGFGQYHYKYESGHEGDMCLIGFSPRKSSHSLYLPGGHGAYAQELQKLGKHKTGKGCLYINKLEDVDVTVLKAIFKKAAQFSKEKS